MGTTVEECGASRDPLARQWLVAVPLFLPWADGSSLGSFSRAAAIGKLGLAESYGFIPRRVVHFNSQHAGDASEIAFLPFRYRRLRLSRRLTRRDWHLSLTPLGRTSPLRATLTLHHTCPLWSNRWGEDDGGSARHTSATALHLSRVDTMAGQDKSPKLNPHFR